MSDSICVINVRGNAVPAHSFTGCFISFVFRNTIKNRPIIVQVRGEY